MIQQSLPLTTVETGSTHPVAEKMMLRHLSYVKLSRLTPPRRLPALLSRRRRPDARGAMRTRRGDRHLPAPLLRGGDVNSTVLT